MSTSAKQDNEFLVDVVGTGLLENAMDWIARNLSPNDVFSEKDLVEWASGEKPENLFHKDDLADWATSNGFIKE